MAFLGELKRRNVHKILAAYIVAAWGLIEVAGSAFPGWGIPEAAIRHVWIAAILGFPIAIAFSWRFDISTARLRKTPRKAADSVGSLHGYDYLVLATLCTLALSVIGWLAIALHSEVQSSPIIEYPIKPEVELDALGLAVIPFEYVGDVSDEKGFLVSGIYNNLMAAFGRIRGIRVVSSQTMKAFADSTRPISDIATE